MRHSSSGPPVDMSNSKLFDAFVDSCGRVLANAQKEFTKETIRTAKEIRAENQIAFSEIRREAESLNERIKSDFASAFSSFKDAIEQKLATIKDGAPGQDGKDGQNGIDGKDGRDGVDGKDGKDGEAGGPGQDGKDGEKGLDGKDGRDGVDGQNGRDGEPGIQGEKGRDGIDGLAGKDGRDGIDGQKGDTGPAPTEEAILAAVTKCLPTLVQDEDGMLNAVFYAGEMKSLGRVRGRDGSDGRPGERGADAPDNSYVPDEVAIKTAMGKRMLAERPSLELKTETPQQIVVHVPQQAQRDVTKRIKTWRDKDGNLVADIVETV